MARPGRPRSYDPISDDLKHIIRQGDLRKLRTMITIATVNVTDGESRTPLFEAILQSNSTAILFLLDHGAEVNHQDRIGMTPLHFAVQEKLLDTVSTLISRGADVNLLDRYGNGPLWRATFDARGSYDLVRILLAAGANPHHKNKAGRSPIDFATTIGEEPLQSILERN